jgi:serine/threonine protein kinase
MLAPQTILQNRYRIGRVLGQGGMGTVYEAIDQRINCVVALKETIAGGSSEARRAFEREASLLGNLRHASLPKVMDFFAEGDGEFLVMEFIPGRDLAELLDKRGQPFSQSHVLTWAEKLLELLEYLHGQKPPILHRDIKPANLKLTDKGEIILLDFGLAKGAVGQMPTMLTSRSVRGYTPVYASLEQIHGHGTDPRSDLYSLGATLYHLLSGIPPIDAPTRFNHTEEDKPDPLVPIEKLNPAVLPQLASVIHQAMAIRRKHRPARATVLLVALRNAMAALPGLVLDPPPLDLSAPQPPPPTVGGEKPAPEAARQIQEAATLRKQEQSHLLVPTTPPATFGAEGPAVQKPLGAAGSTLVASPPAVASARLKTDGGSHPSPPITQTSVLPQPAAKSRARHLVWIIAIAGVLVLAGGVGAIYLAKNKLTGITTSRATAELEAARKLRDSYLPHVDTPQNIQRAQDAIAAFEKIYRADPDNDEAFKAIVRLHGYLGDESKQLALVTERAQNSSVAQEKRAAAYSYLAASRWQCSYNVSESNKETFEKDGNYQLRWKKPSDPADLDKMRTCITSGLSDAEEALTLNSESTSAWAYKANLLVENAKLAEMEGRLDDKALYSKQADVAQRRFYALNEQEQQQPQWLQDDDPLTLEVPVPDPQPEKPTPPEQKPTKIPKQK